MFSGPYFWWPWHSWGILPRHLVMGPPSGFIWLYFFFCWTTVLSSWKNYPKGRNRLSPSIKSEVYDTHIILLQKQQVTQFLPSLNAHFLLKQPKFTSYFIFVLSGTSQYWTGPIPQSTNNLYVFFILKPVKLQHPMQFPCPCFGGLICLFLISIEMYLSPV